ncbi:MAG: class I SAM-dependent methyltransferase [Gemmatimonadota bacterium]
MMPACETERDVATCGACGNPLGARPLARVMFQGVPYEVRPCARCGGAGTYPVPVPEEMARFYGSGSYRSDDGARFNAFVERLVALARGARRRRVERYAGRRGRLLDVGCGRGLFLRVMRVDGWEVAGVEADADVARRISAAHGLDVRCGDPGGWGFADGSFDVVTLHHVLEHLLQPAEMIGHCRRLLRDGGLLLAAVPNRDSAQAAFGGARWFHLDVPFHLHHFTAAGLAGLLRKSGFRVVRERHLDMEQNVFGWIQTLLNRCGLRRNLLFDFMKRPFLRGAQASAGRAWGLALSFALLPPIVPAGAALALLEAAARRGGTVEIAAVRERA